MLRTCWWCDEAALEDEVLCAEHLEEVLDLDAVAA